MQLFNNKKAEFRDLIRGITVGNVFFAITIGMFLIYFISLLFSKIFHTAVIKIGTPFKFLIVIMALVLTFYIVTRQQGSLDRTNIFALILIGLGITALFYYGPKFLPEVLGNAALAPLASDNSAFTTLRNVSVTLHDVIQSSIPIP